jgi:hypothetical protein
VDHLDEVPGAARAAVQIALLGGRSCSPLRPGALDVAGMPGPGREDRVQVLTASVSPPIIRQ